MLLKLIESILQQQKNQYDILVLKGFENDVFKTVSKSIPYAICPLNEKEEIDLEKVQKGFLETFKGVESSSKDEPKLLFFESFLKLGQNINIDQIGKEILVIENNLLNEYPNQSDSTSKDFERLISLGESIPEKGAFYQFYANAIERNGNIFIQFIDGISDEFKSVKTIYVVDEETLPKGIMVHSNNLTEKDLLIRPFSEEFEKYKLEFFRSGVSKYGRLAIDKSIKIQSEAKREIGKIASFIERLAIPLEFIYLDDRIGSEYRDELQGLLSKHWKSETFRTLEVYEDPDVNNNIIEISQAAVVETVIQQYEQGFKLLPIRDILLTAPTGAGKSLLFQMPAFYLAEKYDAVTIVISPLIALMKDQVSALKNERNYRHVAFINSELSLIERDEVVENVKNGDISILYMSPELLLSYEISTFIGDRELGLLVIDEAHLVTTWGRDFRVDYWYLGTYIRKIRKYYDYKFIVLAVTATAVYGGQNDMIFETLDSLSLENALLYIGKVRRDDIRFDLKQTAIDGSHEREKIQLTAQRIGSFIDAKEKSIVYCPWTSQLRPIELSLEGSHREQTGLYFGRLDKEIKNETYESFKNNRISTIISTKAFGMGVDIDDITTVYHHAPSGHLTDYVQEIGRVARRKDIIGKASIDFNIRDLKFTRILYGLSSLKQYQIQLVLEKLIKIYNLKKNRNIIVSIEDFQHIFNGEHVDVDQKVKSSLLIIEKDLLSKHRYNLVIARPKSLFTTVFVRVNIDDNDRFNTKYSQFIELIPHAKIKTKGQLVYKVELDKLWERYYSDKSFPLIKKEFFDKTLFESDGLYVSPQFRIVFNLNNSPEKTFKLLSRRFTELEEAFAELGNQFFRKQQLVNILKAKYNDRLLAKRISDLILSIYSSPTTHFGNHLTKSESYIQQRRVAHEYQYRVISKAYPKVKSIMRRRYDRLFGDCSHKVRQNVVFIPVGDEKNIGIIHLSYILEAFDLASNELSGGENPSVFVRINDPEKISRILRKGYHNNILTDIDKRQKTSVKIMEYFFTNKLSDEQRWSFIEDYFLGNDIVEAEAVEINDENDD